MLAVCATSAARAQHQVAGPVLPRDRFLHLPDGVGDIADHFDLREIDRIDLGGAGRDVDHLRTARFHEERRLFDHVMTDVDDAVRSLDRAVNEIACTQCCTADELGMSFVDHALAKLGCQEGDAGLVDEFQQHLRRHRPIRARADDENGGLGGFQLGNRCRDGLCIGARPTGDAARDRHRVGLLVGDVLGQFEMDGAGLFLLGQPNRLADAARNIVGACHLIGEFRDRPHHPHDIQDLEPALFRFLDRFLAGDHQHRHPAQLGIGRRCHEIGGSRSQRRQANAGLAGVPSIGRGHESRALLMPRQDQFDLGRSRQAVEEIKVLLAGHAEDVLDALVLEALDEQV
jgi:hypothetical protein